MFRGSVKDTGYPLHSPVSPSLPLLCVTVSSHFNWSLQFSLEHAMKAQRRECRYSSTPFLISALDMGGWPTPRPGRLTPGKETRYSLYSRLGGPQDRSGRVRKILPPTGIRSPDRPARSEPLYRLRYPGPHTTRCVFWEEKLKRILTRQFIFLNWPTQAI